MALHSGGSQSVAVAMVGQGFMGDAHSRAWRLAGSSTNVPDEAHLHSVSGRDRDRLIATSHRFGWTRAYEDWSEQLADEEIDLVDIVTPNALHGPVALAALTAGKDVVCEKPLAPSAREALELWRRAGAAGALNVCAFNYRYFPAIRRAKELIERGAIGAPLYFRGSFLTAPAAGESGTGSWRRRTGSGAGVLCDQGSHHIDLARYLVGEVEAVTARFADEAGARIDDAERTLDASAHLLLDFSSGATGTILAGRIAQVPDVESSIEIGGTEGTIAFALRSLNELVVATGAGRQTLSVTHPNDPFLADWFPLGHAVGWPDSFVFEMTAVLRARAGDAVERHHLPTFLDGYRCAAVCDAAMASAAAGGDAVRVSYAPDTEPLSLTTP